MHLDKRRRWLFPSSLIWRRLTDTHIMCSDANRHIRGQVRVESVFDKDVHGYISKKQLKCHVCHVNRVKTVNEEVKYKKWTQSVCVRVCVYVSFESCKVSDRIKHNSYSGKKTNEKMHLKHVCICWGRIVVQNPVLALDLCSNYLFKTPHFPPLFF